MSYRIISADSHMTEPPDLWTSRLDVKHRDHAPKVIESYEGKKGAYFVWEGLKPFPVGGIFGSGKKSEELPEHFKKGYEAAPKRVWDPAERLKGNRTAGACGYSNTGSMNNYNRHGNNISVFSALGVFSWQPPFDKGARTSSLGRGEVSDGDF